MNGSRAQYSEKEIVDLTLAVGMITCGTALRFPCVPCRDSTSRNNRPSPPAETMWSSQLCQQTIRLYNSAGD